MYALRPQLRRGSTRLLQVSSRRGLPARETLTCLQIRSQATAASPTSGQRPSHDNGLAAPCPSQLHSQHATAGVATQASYSTAAPAISDPIIHDIFEDVTCTWQYVVADPVTSTAAIIDPVLDFDPISRAITTTSADKLLSLVRENGYQVSRILETHAHADHLTAASYLQKRLGEEQGGLQPSIGIGKRIGGVQKFFGTRYGVPGEEYSVVFDKLFEDEETFKIGSLHASVMHLPGHTPDHIGYRIGDNVFCGDSIFHTDIGTARCDFPGGSASTLFQSTHKLLELPDAVKIWVGHDYPPEGRDGPVAWASVKDHKAENKHIKTGVTEEEFVALRNKRDAGLGEPRLLHQSLQVNIRGGRLPLPNARGERMLHTPLRTGGAEW
ncbi:unnamed protein product [Clonostachys solani]|uniref:Metallo-beta-lactamase domain-containing protein n=1 Tax=Clonostachys solani TaxID=160281 RepID=A0A9N9Z9M2_9HYPO|nr:unnamed protein product [Clonostachys solani]